MYGSDTLAWALFKNGRAAEAGRAIDQALRLGTRDPILLYHAGLISQRLGDFAPARDFLPAPWPFPPGSRSCTPTAPENGWPSWKTRCREFSGLGERRQAAGREKTS